MIEPFGIFISIAMVIIAMVGILYVVYKPMGRNPQLVLGGQGRFTQGKDK